ncbi:MAG: glutamate racemase [Actinomycetota bacterium]|nr:glutamate racemase [Actinomycetota bacterium]
MSLGSDAALPPDAADRPIGVFDSGVGGLTVLHELLVQLPHEDFVYLADTARFPYGPRSAEELQRFSLEIAEHLLSRRIKLLVVACNSASAAAAPVLRERMMQTTLGVDVIGVVAPAAVHAVAASRNGKVGLLATDVTVRSGAYEHAVTAIDPHVELTLVPCHDLAELIQRGFPASQELVDTVRGYCAPLREAGVDTVILGSTHYPLVRPVIQRTLGRDVQLITSGIPLSRQVDHVLGSRGLGSPRRGEGDYRFLCTGDVERFRANGTRFLQMPLGEVEHVTLPAGAQVGA